MLFIVGFVGLFLRYLVMDEFEINQLLLLLVFPVASVLVLVIMKWQYNKDRDFQPPSGGENRVTRLGDRISATPKQMYRGDVHIGTYRRFYHKWWKRIVADVANANAGAWYLNLSFSLSNGDHIQFIGINENKIRGNNGWVIWQNDRETGTIRTDFTMKKVAGLNESLYLEYGDDFYSFQSFGAGSKNNIYHHDTLVATGEKAGAMKLVYEFMLVADSDDAEMLFMVYILFNYQFRK